MKKTLRLASFIVGLTLFFTTILPVHAFMVVEIMTPIIPHPIYVDDVNGFDTDTGEITNPVKTITKALDIANSGIYDNYQILLAEGDYSAETFPLTISGKDISMYGGYYDDFTDRDPENHQTDIRGNQDSSELYSVEIMNASSVISGLRIYGQNTGGSVIYVENTDGAGHTVTINSVEIDGALVIGGAVFASLESGDNFTLSGSYIHNIEAWIAAINITGNHENAQIYDNFIYNTQAIGGQLGAENAVIYNNIISKGTAIGLNLGKNSRAYNNTITDNETGIKVVSGVTGAEFYNNIIADNATAAFNLEASATYDYNVYHNNGTILTAAHEIECDPGLSYTSNPNDYQLNPSSECIDKGNEYFEVTVDFFGEARKKDGDGDGVYVTDPGAHEADGDEAAAPVISNNSVSPNVFSPDGNGINDTASISFDLNLATTAKVEIYQNATVIKEIMNEILDSGTHNVTWNGTNTAGDPAGEGDYIYKITATNSEGNDEATGAVTIDFTANQPVCAGFSDVPSTHPLCPAIQYVKDEGIFEGYPDGTFRPADVINRVESTKVILEGFNIPLLPDDGTDLNFSDVIIGEWYMTYLRTAKQAGVVEGYSDGTFKPNQQVVRVELLKIFFETSGEDLSGVIVGSDPYPDTPMDQWYINYVQFSKDNALVNADPLGFFNPAQGIKRGDVATLFYRFHQEGFI
jgi:hypothetical protein